MSTWSRCSICDRVFHTSEPNQFTCATCLDKNDSARENAITRVTRNANPDFINVAYDVGETLAYGLPELLSEDIFANMPPGVTTHEPRVMATVMRRLRADGVIAPTEQYTKSPSPRGHSRPSRVWRSLVYAE